MLPDKKKRKNFKKVFGKSDKVSTFAVPSAREGGREKRNKGRKARDKAEARCGGGEFFKILIM
ncbi:hypothetical protein GCM10023173_26660 [Sphingobacterium thermophilum]|uniref:Uncharacterized protein n=1 Tax=Sphingobacterium thermophilum TaxID=768534 RepID=A0ABP8R8Y5_9SPHI